MWIYEKTSNCSEKEIFTDFPKPGETEELDHPEFDDSAPLTRPKPGAPGAGLDRSGIAREAMILVMDDDLRIRETTTQLLQHMGYRVTSCSNGEDAIRLYNQALNDRTPFLAAIIDLSIADGMGGSEAAQDILVLDPEARLIVSSGHSFHPALLEFANHGFCAALPKPYRFRDLVEILERVRHKTN